MDELQAQAGAHASVVGDYKFTLAEVKNELDHTLRALAAEKTANDLLKEKADIRPYMKRIDELESELRISNEDSKKSQSDCEYLQQKLDEMSKQLNIQLDENAEKIVIGKLELVFKVCGW